MDRTTLLKWGRWGMCAPSSCGFSPWVSRCLEAHSERNCDVTHLIETEISALRLHSPTLLWLNSLKRAKSIHLNIAGGYSKYLPNSTSPNTHIHKHEIIERCGLVVAKAVCYREGNHKSLSFTRVSFSSHKHTQWRSTWHWWFKSNWWQNTTQTTREKLIPQRSSFNANSINQMKKSALLFKWVLCLLSR